MALYYNLVFGLLVLEMALFALLSLPLPSKLRKPLIQTISKPFQLKEVTIAIRCILVFILILFIDSVNRVSTINEELSGFTAKQENIGGAAGSVAMNAFGDRSEIQARRFYAQRNLYLTGFTLFLTLILSRTYGLVAELLSLKEQVRAGSEELQVTGDVEALKTEIEEKNKVIKSLKEQCAALSGDYDEVSKEFSSKTSKTTALA
ncbi:hypothetical protein WICPIJ_005277 [Wickerhamomyces pijperi]|uniref:Endoplasmic reticulum transmembrane protein n=1 Tax=Wickerhamomyces pijperi TaxID=599730 RepID=A0A9P8Q3V2_WICPI|nr:hypothetical protein WICPIJ_005277 [Wickerhamomyces pijperi]